MNSPNPVISVLSFIDDDPDAFQQLIAAARHQSYRNVEWAVICAHDIAQQLTDQLVNLTGLQIRIISTADPAAAFWEAVNNARGEIIGVHASYSEWAPDALTEVAAYFDARDIGAVIGVGANEPIGAFNFVDFLFGDYTPTWQQSFFSRRALLESRPKTHTTFGNLPFAIWCGLATRFKIKKVSGLVEKSIEFGLAALSGPQLIHALDERMPIIEALFSENGFFGTDDVRKAGCLYNQLYRAWVVANACGYSPEKTQIEARIQALFGAMSVVDKFQYEGSFSTDKVAFIEEERVMHDRASYMWARVAVLLPSPIRKAISGKAKQFVRETFRGMVVGVHRRLFPPPGAVALQPGQAVAVQGYVPVAPAYSKTLYHHVANLYYARGQIEQALAHWARTDKLRDANIDSIACQAELMLPETTYQDLLEAHQRWAQRHIKPVQVNRALAPRKTRAGSRKIRIGYHCAFMDSDTIRAIMGKTIDYRDRSRFETYAYSVTTVSADVRKIFDVVRVTYPMPDGRFVDRVRRDEIDIFVELTGFSPLNRFNAMAMRVAPIQISHLNHTGTTAVPNIDYVFAGEADVLPEEDKYFTERVWRMPGSFLCYNYDMLPDVPVAEPPSLKNGYITFGYFGSGGKVNDVLIELWAGLMARVPGSRFLMRNNQLALPDNCAFMVERFGRHGIAAERLRILPGADRTTIIKSYDEVDISLDTWPYCGGNTVAEALWQGVPVITLKGNRFSGRYGASLVVAAGCPEWVANTPDQYVEIAAALAADSAELMRYRQQLRTSMMENGLSDARRFAKKLDNVYISMLEQYDKNN